METTFGLGHVWQQGDWVIKTVAALLLLMSIASWTVIVKKALSLRRQLRNAQQIEGFWHSGDFAEGMSKLGVQADNAFYLLAAQGNHATSHIKHLDGETSKQLHDNLDVSEWVSRALRNAIDDSVTRLQSGLVVLASVGSTAPFIGLFGTVWGIYHALMGMASAGSATIDKVAGPIGEALIMTALGLVVAIPAVLAYNALVRGNKGLIHKLNRFAHDLHAYFLTGARVSNSDKNGNSNPSFAPKA
jgi:biopolymer transport protein ExbB